LPANAVRATLAYMLRTFVVFLSLAAAGIAAPAALGAGDARITAVDLPAASSRALAVTRRDSRFTLVGIHWRGSGHVSFRTRSIGGSWSPWRPSAPEEEDRPDSGSAEARSLSGWRIGSPWWVGPSDGVETRTIGHVTRVKAYLVSSPANRIPFRVPAATQKPAIVPRLSWGADESIRRTPPTFAPKLRFAIVHHTAGQNNYTRAESPAIVKAIELYHVQGNGWNDIGYNYLVDRFGTIYEGRYGGIERNVVGAHALGFNTGSTGIAVLGTYGSAAPSRAAQDALAQLLAWRLDLAHVDPLGMVTVVSGGSERFAPGVPVPLRTVSGHRDTGLTECPGDAFYARLDAIAAAASKIGGPKIFDPRVDVAKTGPVRFRARLSRALAWTVAVSDGDGNPVATGTGVGATVDWTWDGAAPPATYRWAITADDARPATGSVRAGTGTTTAALAVQNLAGTPDSISPNGDGEADVSVVSFELTAAATVTVEVLDATQVVVLSALTEQRMAPGEQSVVLDGSTLADGSYTIAVRARGDDGSEVESFVPLFVSRLLGVVTATPTVFSPNGDGRRDRLEIGFELTASADVRVRIVREGRWVATPLMSGLQAGPQSLVWDGTRNAGRLRDGPYEAIVEASNEVGKASFAVPFVVDTSAPLVRIVSLRPLLIEVNEPAVLKLTLDGISVRREVKRARVIRIRWSGPHRQVRIVAWDEAGNASVPVIKRLGAGSKRQGQ
jgi:flagellar hook assembly protein FlgD